MGFTDDRITRFENALQGLVPVVEVPQFELPRLPPLPTDPNLASEFYERLVRMIQEFDAELDNQHEVGIRLVSFGQTVIFHLTDLGYFNPSLIRFYGKTESDEPVELIQHVSQISILLMRVKRADPSQPKRAIGFHSEMPGAFGRSNSGAVAE